MESLRAEMIVRIFSFLPPEDLVGPVRAVCRAWRRLALQWDAWEHASLSWTQDNTKLLERVLRLAPRLRSLEVDSSGSSPELLRAMDTTQCQIERLHINTCKFPCSFHFWRKQVPHVKYLSLVLDEDDAAIVLHLIQDMALVELDFKIIVSTDADWDGPLFDRPFRNGRLKRLAVYNCSDSDRLIESLVTANAASLAEFASWSVPTEMPLTWKAVRALNCKLKLTLPASSLQSVVGMENLSHLTVRLSEGECMKDEGRALKALSTGLIRPSSVAFEAFLVREFTGKSMIYCLLEMGTLGRCGHVESVTIRSLCLNSEQMTTMLLPSLSGLSNLRELHLEVMWQRRPELDALEGLKSLQLLDLSSSVDCFPECWNRSLRRLVTRAPGLHVIGLLLRSCCVRCLSVPDIQRRRLYGLRGHCRPECATCARHWSAIEGRWISTEQTDSD